MIVCCFTHAAEIQGADGKLGQLVFTSATLKRCPRINAGAPSLLPPTLVLPTLDVPESVLVFESVPSPLFTDHSLACRLERAEAVANARFVEARARVLPDSGAAWLEVAGAYAMYDGPRSPCTQTFGLGLFQMPTSGDMDRIESFFKERRAPVFHEVSPLADKALLPLLNERGYKPVELSHVMFLSLRERDPDVAAQNESLRVRIARPEERESWAGTAAEGWREFGEIADLMLELMRVSVEREDSASFLVECDGQAIAAGSLAIHDGVALFAGASTVPEWRRRGAQRLLFEARCRFALDAGCELAMVCTEPGSSSQRNAERQGFRVAYTRTKWQLTESEKSL